jgi:hypothetical protein
MNIFPISKNTCGNFDTVVISHPLKATLSFRGGWIGEACEGDDDEWEKETISLFQQPIASVPFAGMSCPPR